MKRPIVWSTIFTICGIYMRLGISEMICLVSVFYVILSLVYIIKKYKDFRYFGLILFTILGFVSAGLSVSKETADIYLKHPVYGEGVIREAGSTSSGNQKLFIQCDLRDESENTLEDMMIYGLWMEEGTFCTGDRISFYGELEPFLHASVPGGYDEDLYLRTRGFDGKIYLDSVTVTGEDHSVSSLLANARGKVHQTLNSILPANESAVMKAMLTGEKDDIPDETYELYQNAGAVHILCISGLHMSILGLYVSFFLEKILKQSRRVSAAVTMAASVCFLLFTGFTPSAVRAVTMLCVVMTGRILFRSHDRLNEIAVAALLILLIEPLYLFHIGFQLSFITVLGLCIAAENMEEKKNKNWIDKLKDALRFSIYASLFSYPFVAYHFYTISLVGILANLIVIPLSGLLLGFGILSAVLGMVWMPAGVFAAGSVYGILRFIEITCTLLLKIPFACILTGRPTELVILLFYILLFLWIKIGERKGCWKAALVVCLALWCAVFGNQLFRKETTIAFLDVGQGDAAVISAYDGKTYLIDGGGKYGKEFGKNVGQTVLLPYLQYLGKDHVDAVFLSHPDTDHMTGLLEIMGKIEIKEMYLADYPYLVTENIKFLKEILEKYPVRLYTVDNTAVIADQTWEVLYPMKGIRFSDGDDNHGSMVLKYKNNDTEVLFTGDISLEDESLLISENTSLSADILKVSHHGSMYSSSAEFLEKVDAETSVISCGRDNIYGHPHKETMERLQGTNIYRTDEQGSVLLKLQQDGGYKIETMTERKPLYERIKETMEKW